MHGIGNLTEKGGKTYTYAGCGAGPHAVCTVGGGAPFEYDANGNMTSGNGRTVAYNPANKPVHIGNDTGTVDFIYGADGHRVRHAPRHPDADAQPRAGGFKLDR